MVEQSVVTEWKRSELKKAHLSRMKFQLQLAKDSHLIFMLSEAPELQSMRDNLLMSFTEDLLTSKETYQKAIVTLL